MGKKYERAALYALYPNELGLCGPRGSEKGKLYQYLTLKSRVNDNQARKLLEQFVAATAYMKLIAQTNEIDDWLDPRVVDAYWIGNELLNRVRPEDLGALILGFVGAGRMTKTAAEEAIGRIHYEHRPHHSFHVFTIGGISGQVEPGSVGWDLCRIGWGRVVGVERNGALTVSAISLQREGGRFLPKLKTRAEECPVRRDSQLFPRLSVGDIIAFHWGRVVEVIDEDAAERLLYWTERTLRYCKS